MATLAERFQAALAHRQAIATPGESINPAGLARACGVRQPSVSDWLNGKTKSLAGTNLMHAASYLKVRQSWLGEGLGPMVDDRAEALLAGETQAGYAIAPTPGAVTIPQLDVRASMGGGIDAPDRDSVVRSIQVHEDSLRRLIGNTPISGVSGLRLVSAYGDSMTPTFNDGDLLLVDTGVYDVKLDAIYVLSLHESLYIKRLQRRIDGTLSMISDNRNYEPQTIVNGDLDRFRVLGRVLLAWNAHKL
ncbi:MAG: S24 family peptidase [Bacteroidia bacterium]